MTNRHNDILDFRYLLNRAFDRTITQDETVRLNCLFAEHPEFELEYFNFIKFQLSFRELKSIHQANSDNTLPRFDEMLHQFSEWENVAPAMKIEPAGSMAACHIPKTGETLKVNRFLFAVALASLAAFLALAAYVRLNPRFSVRQIATLTDAIDAQWVAPLHVGDRLSNKAGEYVLRKGFAKLTWDNGVTVNIEGPAQFALLTPDKMKMDTGRLFAHVPDEARGFIVKTPGSSIIDLGTEFGIKLDNDGSASIHMFKGKASLVPGSKGQGEKGELLLAGQAKWVDITGSTQDIPLAQTSFVRNINSANRLVWRGHKKINLANILGGGNGFDSAERNVGVDPVSGAMTGFRQQNQTSSNRFVIIHHNPYIDGVFVPDGAAKQIVSSRGDVFAECPETSGYFYTDICNTPIDVVRSMPVNRNPTDDSCILLHANAGITFDLDAIRADFPGHSLVRFESRLRISEAAPRKPQADFWILVDGKPRYSKLGVTTKGDIEAVRIDLARTDRFLTLAATEGGKLTSKLSIDSDWCVFAEPVLIVD
jgi:hypothetical protein